MSGRHIAPEGHQAGVPAQLDAFFGQLLGELLAVGAAAHEDVEILLLQLLGDLHGDLIGRGRAGDRGKPGGGAVDKLDAALAHDDIAGRAQPDAVDRLGADQVLAGLDDLAGKQRRHAGIERVAQVGQPDLLRRAGRQQLLGPAQNPAQVGQRLHLLAGEGIDHRQVVGRIGKADGAGLAFGGDGLVELGLGAGDPGDGAFDGAGTDYLRH